MEKHKKVLPLVAKLVGGIAFMALFIFNTMLFVKKHGTSGSLSLASLKAFASTSTEETGGGSTSKGCYTATVLKCSSNVIIDYGERIVCSFTGYYGYPYGCTETKCGDVNGNIQRTCVKGGT